MPANRRVSDVSSGLELKREEYPNVSSDDLDRHFQMFQAYDLDSSGFVSPENMLNVLMAMGVPDVTMETVCAMMDEVAVLTGHENDGKLTFRDFMNIVQHDRTVVEQETSSDDSETPEPSGGVMPAVPATAVVEMEMTPRVEEPSHQDQAKPSQPEPESPAQRPHNHRSSFSALNSLASSRIKAFQASVHEASEREKLNAFKKKPVVVTGPMVNSDDMHMQSLRSKLQAFEIAATHKGTIERKKTWKKAAGAGNYIAGQKILLGGEPVGVAPKKKLSELP